MVPQLAALASGSFSRRGLTVEVVRSTCGSHNVDLLDEGRTDVAFVNIRHALTAMAGKSALRSRFVFASSRRSHMAALYVEDRPAAHGRPIRSVGDLAKATVAVSSDYPWPHRELLALLANQLQAAPGALVDVAAAEVKDALADGAVDVAAKYIDLAQPFAIAVGAAGGTLGVLPFADAGLREYPLGVMASTAAIDEQPEELAAFVAGLREGYMAAIDRPTESVAVAKAAFPDLHGSPSGLLRGWETAQPFVLARGEPAPVGLMELSGCERTLAHHESAHGLGAVEVADVYDLAWVEAGPPD